MIDCLVGSVKKVTEGSVVIVAQGVGFLVASPRTSSFKVNSQIEMYTYLHWNPENGPSLYGFETEIERTVFLLIIECPTIGPKIALSILSGMTSQEFVHAIHTEDTKKLSSISGIGDKKAEQMIVTLKRKVSKLLASGQIHFENHKSGIEWNTLSEALLSLGYTRQEIHGTIAYLAKLELVPEESRFDHIMRKALAYLAQTKQL